MTPLRPAFGNAGSSAARITQLHAPTETQYQLDVLGRGTLFVNLDDLRALLHALDSMPELEDA